MAILLVLFGTNAFTMLDFNASYELTSDGVAMLGARWPGRGDEHRLHRPDGATGIEMDRVSLGIALATLLLIGGLLASSWSEDPRDVATSAIDDAAPPQILDGSAPAISFRRRDGTRIALRALDGPTLVHFWATWCPPCLVELPGLLALPDDAAFDVIAVSVDSSWEDVERFFDGELPARVALGKGSELQSLLGIANLPATLLVDAKGRLVYRFDGARDWHDASFVSRWLDPAEH